MLTPAGWNRVAELEEGRTGERPDQAFVAMCFADAQMIGDKRVDLKLVFHDGLRVGIAKAGYRPRRIDEKEFTGDVVDEIMTEIRRSRFVVADFTGHRKGVYYEAGFGRGLGMTVISTCHRDDLGGAHFDTRNINHLVWADAPELAKNLEHRIVATIGQGPLDPEKVLAE
jgi:hypothetical protein